MWPERTVLVMVISVIVFLALVAFCSAVVTKQAQAEEFENSLVLVVDVSGSVTDAEYEFQRSGYVEVLLDPMVATALEGTAVAIVEFSTDAVVTVAWTDVRGAAAAYRSSERPFMGTTCVACGLELALEILDGRPGRRVIDISGDGEENVRLKSAVLAIRDLATTRGIEINTLALLLEEQETWMAGACTGKCLGEWYANIATGFAMSITEMGDFQEALRRKLFTEIVGHYLPGFGA